MLLVLLLAGGAAAQDDLGVDLDILEPDLDYLLETLEAVSCLCSCEDWCAGRCAGASSCEAWCPCEAARSGPPTAPSGGLSATGEPPGGEARGPVQPVASPPVPAALPAPAAGPEEDAEVDGGGEVSPFTGVFDHFGEVAVPTCACIWRGASCSAEASWPAAGGGCECAEEAPGCGGESTSISLLLLPREEKSQRR